MLSLERGEAEVTRAADEIEKERLGEIIHGVGRDDYVEAVSLPQSLEESVAGIAERRFNIVLRSVLGAEDGERDCFRFTKLLYQSLIAIRVAATEAVIDMRGAEQEAVLVPEPGEEREEGHAVRTAGNRYDDFRSTRQELLLGERVLKTAHQGETGVRRGERLMRPSGAVR